MYLCRSTLTKNVFIAPNLETNISKTDILNFEFADHVQCFDPQDKSTAEAHIKAN